MKKFATLLVLLSVLFTFSACGSDDDDYEDIDQASLVGTWTLDGATIDKISSNDKAFDKVMKKSLKEMDYSIENAGYASSGYMLCFEEDGRYYTDDSYYHDARDTYTVQENKVILFSYYNKEEKVVRMKNNRLVMTETGTYSVLAEKFRGYSLPDNYEIYSITVTTYYRKQN